MFFFLVVKNIPFYFIKFSTSVSNTSPKIPSQRCADISMPERINFIASNVLEVTVFILF